MTSDPALQPLALNQKRWSLTASRLKRSIVSARWTVLALLIAGAFLETLAAQFEPASLPSQAAGYAGAATLAVVAVMRQWKLGRERIQAWVLARSASESYKREMFLYRAKAAPYSGVDAVDLLLDRNEQILKKVAPIRKYTVEPKSEDVRLPAPLDENGYISERINAQTSHFTDRAASYSRLQNLFGGVEFTLAIVAALLGVASAIAAYQRVGPWIAVITTLAGALGAHVAVQRYEQLVTSYLFTADRLTGYLARWRSKGGTLA